MGSVLHFLPKNAISSRFIDPMKLDSFLAGWVGTGSGGCNGLAAIILKFALSTAPNNRQQEPRAVRPQGATDLDQISLLSLQY